MKRQKGTIQELPKGLQKRIIRTLDVLPSADSSDVRSAIEALEQKLEDEEEASHWGDVDTTDEQDLDRRDLLDEVAAIKAAIRIWLDPRDRAELIAREAELLEQIVELKMSLGDARVLASWSRKERDEMYGELLHLREVTRNNKVKP